MAFWKRHDLEARLRHIRPVARDEFIEQLTTRVDRRGHVPARGRFALAAAASAVLLISMAAFGGFGYAAHAATATISSVTTLVSSTTSTQGTTSATSGTPSQNQYGPG